MRDRYDDEELLTREAAADGGEVEEGDELYEHFAVSVDAGQEPMRLDKFLALRMQHCSRNRIQTATDNGNVLVNGRAAKPSYRVKPLDRITLVMPYPKREVGIVPQNIPLDILYEDDDLFYPKPRLALWSRDSEMLCHGILHAAGPMMEHSPFLVHLRIF